LYDDVGKQGTMSYFPHTLGLSVNDFSSPENNALSCPKYALSSYPQAPQANLGSPQTSESLTSAPRAIAPPSTPTDGTQQFLFDASCEASVMTRCSELLAGHKIRTVIILLLRTMLAGVPLLYPGPRRGSRDAVVSANDPRRTVRRGS